FVPELGTKGCADDRSDVKADKGYREREQGCLGVAERRDLAVEGLGQRLEESFHRPALLVQLGDLRSACIVCRDIGQDTDLGVSIRRGFVEANEDAADLHEMLILSNERDALFKHLARGAAASAAKRSLRDDGEVGVLSDTKEALAFDDALQKSDGAEV